MTVRVVATVRPSAKLYQRLGRLDPVRNSRIFSKAAVEVALGIQRNAQKEQILKGGGGKKSGYAPAHPTKLTSRTGHLRRSIRVDRSKLPWRVTVGTDVGYGAVHEFGGRVEVKAHSRVNWTTRLTHRVSAYTRKVTPRPFMKPALEWMRSRGHIEEIFIKHWRREADR